MAKAVRSIHVGLPEGHGEVYRARDPKLNRDVAIKILPEALPAQGLVQAGVMAVSGRGPPTLPLTGTMETVGAWRSLVAHLLWEQVIAGLNPVTPTRFQPRGNTVVTLERSHLAT